MKIMLVDDDQATGMSLTRALMDDYVVNLVTDGQTALNVAEVYKYDLILLNLSMTNCDSIELCETLRNQGYKGLIFMLSRGSRAESQAECLRSIDVGANDCLTTPYEVKELLSRVHALLAPH